MNLDSTKETLEQTEEADVSSLLSQLKLSLQGKLEVLKELDKIILENVKEDETESEIEQSDIINETINKAIFDIESKLTTHGASKNNSQLNSETLASTEGNSHKSKIKLPKYQPQKFSGDVTKWSTFWDSYEAAVHLNTNLADIEKFSYLKSFLDSEAAEAIAGLSLTSSNYSEAIELLKKRFGNKQAIINKHMENLLSLEQVKSLTELKNLRKLFDKIEAEKRGLRALGILSDSYGNLLTSVVMNKLPQELRIIISRKIKNEEWDLDSLLNAFEEELEARERAARSDTKSEFTREFKTYRKECTTAAFLLNENKPSKQPSCTYCKENNPSASCHIVTNKKQRKDLLRRSGRCFVCLRKNHISKECTSKLKCVKCGARHHNSICMAGEGQQQPFRLANRTQEQQSTV